MVLATNAAQSPYYYHLPGTNKPKIKQIKKLSGNDVIPSVDAIFATETLFFVSCFKSTYKKR